ncbi:hypothetical protein MMC22_012099 [Lobaria immixta]|nr:hypothetical protein [Lobaria immixta]
MHVSTTSASREASKPRKHKAACDQCNASKVKCPGGGPPCKWCADSSHPCHYSLARRIGKPPGSKNRKTLEKLRQEKEGNLKSNNGGDGGGDGSITHNNDSRKMTTKHWMLRASAGKAFSRSFRRLELPGFEELEGAESRRPWADAPDDCWNSSSPSIGPQLSSGPADTDSPLLEFSHSSVFETNKPMSLDTVAARLEETTGSTTTHLEQRQQTLCRCLRKYADVLCELQTIEKRQRSIQVDTLLTCANLALNIIENQLRCTQCLEKRKSKEMTARIETPREAEKLKGKSSKDILQAAQGAGVEITGTRRLPNGEVSFHTRSQNVRDTLQANTERTKAVVTSARVQKKTFAAFAHDV